MLKITNKSEKILINYGICLQIYMIPVLIQISFHTPIFFLFERICPYEREKNVSFNINFQQVIG